MTIDGADRARLLTEADQTFFVEAGAGTGKTTVLVGRIVMLVAAGYVTMEGLAAITFTEAAAAELRDRVRESLEKATADPSRTEDERRRCLTAIEEIDLAAIQTIHAFAGGLLRAYPLEAGLPPGFATLDEIEQDVQFEERFRAWFWGAALAPPVGDIIRRALLLGLTQQQLRDLAAAFEEQHDLLTPATTWESAPPLDAVAAAREVGESLIEIEAWVQYALNGPSDPLVQVVARAQPWARRLRACATEEQALGALCGLGEVRATAGAQRNWSNLPDGTNACRAIKERLGEVKARMILVLESHRAATLAQVLVALRDLTLANVAARRAAGVATFQDLLTWARDLLRDQAEVRRRAQERYRRIFVDEFQDTDPLQAEIVFYLAAEPDDPLPTDWRAIRLVPGKLFVVGDPKQSIYRFRRADIGVYDDLLRRMADGRVYLVQNFRSVGPLLAWVNHHFTASMQAVPGIQPSYVDLHAHREQFDGGVRCGVYRVGQPVGGNATAVAATEADALVELIHRAVEKGWLVGDTADDGTPTVREARYDDICILVRSRTHLRLLERALEEGGVPYRLESGALILGTQEVRDLLAGLRAIDDPSDQIALIGALRSPAFNCSDPDLLRWVEGGGRLSYEEPGEGPDGPVKDALRCLADFHARKHLLSPPALIEAYIADRLLVASAFDDPRPRETWRRLRYVVSRARQLTATGRHSLRAFLNWIDGLERAEARDVESAEAEPDEIAVRILTIHKAKGLEFPIVLLAGLGAGQGGGSGAVEVIADRQTGALACRVGQEWRTAGFEEAQARERRMAEAELVRLLYVATTRARDHLVLSLYRGPNTISSPAALIEDRLEGTGGLCHPLVVGGTGALENAESWLQDGDGLVDWGSVEHEQAWLARRRELVNRLGAVPRVGTGAVVRTADDEHPPVDEDDCDPHDLAQKVRALVRRLGLGHQGLRGDEDPLAVERARAIVESQAFKDAVANPTCRWNVPLLGMVESTLLDFVADLVYETPHGVVLVAYDLHRGHTLRVNGPDADCAFPGLLCLAFTSATRLPVHAIEVVDGRSGVSTRYTDTAALAQAMRTALQ
jgi:ATP-dependent helicase/nuclease subunit A